MSATVNSERFSQYFHGCLSLTIPGFTHPVAEYFLSDVHEMLGQVSPHPSHPQGKQFKPDNSFKVWCYQDDFFVCQVNSPQDSLEADADLVSDTILCVCRNYPEGAILCFLSGWDEITVVHDMLSNKIQDKSNFLVLALHSMLPMFNQQAVFERPPVGVRKIVLATNIAETSITIDDVVYVINAGNEKEKMYDGERKVSCLMTHWTSQASVVQRRGRAGRCKPGLCFNLFTREQFEHMAPYQSAEIQRVSLEEIVLQTKIQCSVPCKVQELLSKALDPPSPFAVHSAVSQLQDIGALDDKEGLTALGKHMAFLPVEPRIAKMIIYGAIFRCLDTVLTIAAGLSYKDPFVSPMKWREQADQSRKQFAGDSRSDHVAVLNAYNSWTEAMSHSRGKEFVQQRFLHWGTLNMIRGFRCYNLPISDQQRTSETRATCMLREKPIETGNVGSVYTIYVVARVDRRFDSSRPSFTTFMPKGQTGCDGCSESNIKFLSQWGRKACRTIQDQSKSHGRTQITFFIQKKCYRVSWDKRASTKIRLGFL
ncbi:uncharacterized protein [Montipora foliosa]|uniref:uncharacterized protein n=1 Tax=Montipora foliosa TaxID=591990 RepID=UPI0035F13125